MTAAIAPAIVAALGELDELHRDKTANVRTKDGGSYTYSYTDLASVLGYARPILAKHDLAVTQPVTGGDGWVTVRTVFLHASGEERCDGELSLPAGRTPQETGSAISYARRYSLLAALGLATEDDDGKAASKPAPKPKPVKAAAKPATPSAALTRRVMAQFGELGVKDRAERLLITSDIVGREVESWKDVSPEEARNVTDALEIRLSRLRDVPDGVDPVTGELFTDEVPA
jgi:hypothetical protein